MNLAPVKYRNVLAKFGGPIARVEYAKDTSPEGTPWFRSSAYLVDGLKPKDRRLHRLYADCDGTGTARQRAAACYKSISEALERWAYWATYRSQDSEKYGFDQDPTTTGMAAFPGLTTRAARQRAHFEAVERWAMIEWWADRLPASIRRGDLQRNGSGALEIVTSFPGASVAVLWKRLAKVGLFVYGFSAGATFAKASSKALYELARNELILRARAGSPEAVRTLLKSGELQVPGEARLLFFATDRGFQTFCRKAAGNDRVAPVSSPKLLVDRQISGNWTRYATVWRVLYESSITRREINADPKFFLF